MAVKNLWCAGHMAWLRCMRWKIVIPYQNLIVSNISKFIKTASIPVCDFQDIPLKSRKSLAHIYALSYSVYELAVTVVNNCLKRRLFTG